MENRKQTYVRLSDKDKEALAKIKETYDCTSTNEAIRIAVKKTAGKVKGDGFC